MGAEWEAAVMFVEDGIECGRITSTTKTEYEVCLGRNPGEPMVVRLAVGERVHAHFLFEDAPDAQLNIRRQHVMAHVLIDLLEAAGYRVETPREASATKALLLEAADVIDSEFGTRKGTHPIVASLRKAAER